MANGLARHGPRWPWRRPWSRSGVRQERFLFFMAGFRAHFPAVTPPATERARFGPLLTACFARSGSARRRPRPGSQDRRPHRHRPGRDDGLPGGTTAQPTAGTSGQVAARPGGPVRRAGPAARSCPIALATAGLAWHATGPGGTRHRARRKQHHRADLGTSSGRGRKHATGAWPNHGDGARFYPNVTFR